MNSSLAVRSKCHATKRPMRQFTETIFEAFFGGSRFSGKPTAPPPLQNWGQFSNFPASPPCFEYLWTCQIQIVSACRRFGAIACSGFGLGRPIGASFLNINLRFLNDCQVLSTQMFSSATAYLERNFKTKAEVSLTDLTKAFVRNTRTCVRAFGKSSYVSLTLMLFRHQLDTVALQCFRDTLQVWAHGTAKSFSLVPRMKCHMITCCKFLNDDPFRSFIIQRQVFRETGKSLTKTPLWPPAKLP